MGGNRSSKSPRIGGFRGHFIIHAGGLLTKSLNPFWKLVLNSSRLKAGEFDINGAYAAPLPVGCVMTHPTTIFITTESLLWLSTPTPPHQDFRFPRSHKYFCNNNPNFSFVAAGTLSNCVKIANFNAE